MTSLLGLISGPFSFIGLIIPLVEYVDVPSLDLILCPICKTDNYETVLKDGLLNAVLCRNDGLVFLSPRPSTPFYRDFYRNYYSSEGSHAGPEMLGGKQIHANSIISRCRSAMSGKTLRKVLDFGAGQWPVTHFMKKLIGDAEIFAVEENEISHENYPSLKITSLIENELAKHYGTFDFIVMRHVLEHLLDPVDSLKTIERLLAHDGLAYIEVPNMERPKLPLQNYWFRIAHTYYFSPITLAALFDMTELRVIDMHSVDNVVYSIVCSSRFLATNHKRIRSVLSSKLNSN